MPLSSAEANKLAMFMRSEGLIEQGDGGNNFSAGLATGSALDSFNVTVERLISAMTQTFDIVNRLIGKFEDAADPSNATATVEGGQPPKKRGRPSAKDKEQAAAQGNGKADDNPFNEAGTAEKETTANDIFGEGGDSGPATDVVTEDDMKALLKDYMNKHGANGVAKLTTLLSQFGVKRFNDLPADKYAACAAAAKAEMAA